jgi:lipopolysaccharide transport system ATP-binding protein
MVAIQAKHLSKVYRWYAKRTDLIKELLVFNRKRFHANLVALDGVSFEIGTGECVGVIGRNGAGKSTLVKLLAGLSAPTSGSFEVHGKVAALLELGTGFHPDYSGIENIRINGILLGLSRRDIERKLPAIVEFAELEEVIRQPLRTYSTGMQARLAFSIATALEPNILLIDEVLAVGDAYFVNKCITYLQRFIGNGGTALVVSHNSFLLSRLCQRILWLEQGKLLQFDSAQAVCRAYDLRVRKLEYAQRARRGGPEGGERWGTGEIRIGSVLLLNREECQEHSYIRGDRMIVRVNYETAGCYRNPSVYLLISHQNGILATSCFSGEESVDLGVFQGIGQVDVVFDPLLLGDGSYWLSVGIFPHKEGPESIYRLDPYDYHERACEFTVKRPDRPLQTVFDHPVRWSHSCRS